LFRSWKILKSNFLFLFFGIISIYYFNNILKFITFIKYFFFLFIHKKMNYLVNCWESWKSWKNKYWRWVQTNGTGILFIHWFFDSFWFFLIWIISFPSIIEWWSIRLLKQKELNLKHLLAKHVHTFNLQEKVNSL